MFTTLYIIILLFKGQYNMHNVHENIVVWMYQRHQNLKYAKIFEINILNINRSLFQPDLVDHDVCDGTQYRAKKKIMLNKK